MRIAWLSTDFGIPVYGNKGASIHVREIANALQAVGHDVRIFATRLGGDAPAGRLDSLERPPPLARFRTGN